MELLDRLNIPISTEYFAIIEPFIDITRDGERFRASLPLGIPITPEDIEQDGLKVFHHGEVHQVYCPRFLYDGNYACKGFCLSRGARNEMCSERQHHNCATYDSHRADYNAPIPKDEDGREVETPLETKTSIVLRQIQIAASNGNGKKNGKEGSCISSSFSEKNKT